VGSRATPLTEAEGGQKPAILSFVKAGERRLSTVEVALRYFSPVEHYLRKSGFDGVVVKWGDEIQIPTLDLDGIDDRFHGADVVRFVSIQEMTEDLAVNKDWVGVAEDGTVRAFIPRRPLAEMEPLASRGWVQKREGRLFGGINLGSIALSRELLDALLSEFESEVNDPGADRKTRPDLDPQLFTALTIAALPDASAREDAWHRCRAESPAMRELAENLPAILDRLRRVLDALETSRGRPLSMVAMDFGGQYWGDIGQHRSMRELFSSLRNRGALGTITRALAGLPAEPNADGNWLAGGCAIGPQVTIKDSVLIDARINSGSISDSVLIGTQCAHIDAQVAFDIESVAPARPLGEHAGGYRVVSEARVEAAAGERV
ncbi:MAG: hypothetical protein AAF658_21490, partial [Myxococcota bacterium]